MASLPPLEDHRSLVKKINSSSYFLNKQLQHICSLNGLRTQGVKAELQKRLIEALNKSYSEGDAQTYRELQQSINREKNGAVASSSRAYPPLPPTHPPHAPAPQGPYGQSSSISNPGNSSSGNMIANSLTYSHPNGGPSYGGPYVSMNGQRTQPVQGKSSSSASTTSLAPQFVQQLRSPEDGPVFRQSPFYQIVERIGDVHVCEAMAQHRNSTTIHIRPQDHPLLSRCRNDSSLRVMVFCATANYGTQDIAFPHQSELKVNGDEIKANLRGLKNKPGSTRPADITDWLRLKLPHYVNNVDFTYALTTKAGDKASQTISQRYYLVVNICKEAPVDSLVRAIGSRKISKASVMAELTKKANDAEIELSSQVLSLKCPLSYMRLVTPVRATTCTHVQCFDALSYLQLQQQGPQWVCPVCSKPASYSSLAVDEYVRDILANTSKSVEQVNIQPSGEWQAHGQVEDEVKAEPQLDALDLLDGDDFLVSDVSYVGRSTNTPNTLAPTTGAHTPAPGASSRESSSISRPGGTKRTHEVIDLTLSDDDEPDEPVRKRQQYHHPSSRLSGFL